MRKGSLIVLVVSTVLLLLSLALVPVVAHNERPRVVATTTRAYLWLPIASIFGILTAPLGAYISLPLNLSIGSTIALTALLLATAIYAIKKAIETLGVLMVTGG